MNRQRPCYPSSRRPTPIATYVAGCDAATGPPVEFTLFGVTPLRPSARAACETCGQESCVWWWDLCLLYNGASRPQTTRRARCGLAARTLARTEGLPMSNSLPASSKMRSATTAPSLAPLRLVLIVERVPLALMLPSGNIHTDVLRTSPPCGNQAFTQLEKIVTARAVAVNRIERACG